MLCEEMISRHIAEREAQVFVPLECTTQALLPNYPRTYDYRIRASKDLSLFALRIIFKTHRPYQTAEPQNCILWGLVYRLAA